MKKIIFIAASLVMVGLGIITIQTITPRVSTSSLLFLGTTNSSGTTTGTFAMFLFTNTAPNSVLWRPKSIEFQTPDGWRVQPFTTNVQDADYFLPEGWQSQALRGNDGVYGSHANIYYVPWTAASEPWRISIQCQEQTKADRKRHLILLLQGRREWNFSGRIYDVTSPTVKQQETSAYSSVPK